MDRLSSSECPLLAFINNIQILFRALYDQAFKIFSYCMDAFNGCELLVVQKFLCIISRASFFLPKDWKILI